MSEQEFEDEIDLDEDFETPEEFEDSKYSENLEEYLERQMEDQDPDLSGFDGLSLEDIFDLEDDTNDEDTEDEEAGEGEEEMDETEEEEAEEDDTEDPGETEDEEETGDEDEGSDEKEEDSEETGEDEEEEGEEESQQESQNGGQEEVEEDSNLVPEFSEFERDQLSLAAGIILILAALVSSYLVYRSDKNLKQILEMMLSSTLHFLKNLPNLISDEFAKMVIFIVSEIKKLAYFTKSLITHPFNTLKRVSEKLPSVIRDLTPSSFLGGLFFFKSKGRESKELTGIDKFWFKFKNLVGLTNEDTLTPKEVGIKAVKQGYPEEQVGIAVNKYRYEKFGDKSYGKSIEIEKLVSEEKD